MAAPRRPGFAADLVTTPNLITLSRILLVMLGGGLFFAGYPLIGIAVAIVAGVTDYLDGWLARRTGQVTRLGEILDQFCDFFFESVILYVAIASYHFLPLWVMIAYLAREMWVTTIRRFMAGHQLNISSNLLGKMKTNFLSWGTFPAYLSIIGALPSLEPGLAYVGRASIGLGIILGYASAFDYTRQLIAGYDRVAASRAAEGSAGVGDRNAS
jgi:CDP-diacylglycerol--glycerol-3-phosphate 3-phosphatidyltransferase